MGRTARDKRPNVRPVEKIELNDEHVGRRLALMLIFLLLGAGLLVYSFMQLFTPQSEWVTVEANSSAGPTCASEFVFLYRLGGGELSPTAENKAVTIAYTQLCRTAFEVFHNQMEIPGVNNLYAINRHPNQELTVDKALYNALAAVERSGNRSIYLGPVYDRYSSIFYCQDDSQLYDFDPQLNPAIAQEYAAYAAYAQDPLSVQVELLGENRICLRVSEEYLAFAQQEGVESFIDFAWMRNAFIADYLAEELTAQGFGKGAVTSFDGFVRNLEQGGVDYSLQLYDRQGQAVYDAAVMHYQGPMSIVSLRDYPMNAMDNTRFYELRTGEIRTPYADPADGLARNAVHNLTCYARDKGCGEVLLEMLPVYVSSSFHPEALAPLAAGGVYTLYFVDGVIHPTEAGVALTDLYEDEEVRYTIAPAKTQ